MPSKPFLPKQKSSNPLVPCRFGKISTLLFSLSGALLAAAAIAFGVIYGDGIKAAQDAQGLLLQYNSAEETIAEAATASASPTNTVAGQTLTPTDEPKPEIVINGYPVMGTLQIEEIGLQLPIISNTDDEALKTSICYYQGAIPPEKGLMVITGHNYSSGAHFGQLDQLKKGNTVAFTAADGTVYQYQVSTIRSIKPNEPEVLEDYSGEYSLMLMTCTNHGNARLIVCCTGANAN